MGMGRVDHGDLWLDTREGDKSEFLSTAEGGGGGGRL